MRVGLINRSNRFPLIAISSFVFLVLAGWIITRPVDVFPTNSDGYVLTVSLGCMALYLTSHLLRAVRLSVIGLSVHRTSFRTLALLHLAVAPWSMIAPFKIDELIRLNELRSINGSLTRAAITVIIDRSMDGPALLLIAMYLNFTEVVPNPAALYAGLIGSALLAITLSFFALSYALQIFQRYIFMYHYKPRAINALRIIHQLRLLALTGRRTILSAAPMLILCTIGIWCFEISAVGLLIYYVEPAQADLHSIVTATLVRANSGWRELLLGETAEFPAAFMTIVFSAGLLLLWPFAAMLYYRRRHNEVEHAQYLSRELTSSASGIRV